MKRHKNCEYTQRENDIRLISFNYVMIIWLLTPKNILNMSYNWIFISMNVWWCMNVLWLWWMQLFEQNKFIWNSKSNFKQWNKQGAIMKEWRKLREIIKNKNSNQFFFSSKTNFVLRELVEKFHFSWQISTANDAPKIW